MKAETIEMNAMTIPMLLRPDLAVAAVLRAEI
jgi:hypothetical protein